jgi:hypothetical protein
MAQRGKRCQCGGMIKVFKTISYQECDGATKYQRVKCDNCNRTGSQITTEKILWDDSDNQSINRPELPARH